MLYKLSILVWLHGESLPDDAGIADDDSPDGAPARVNVDPPANYTLQRVGLSFTDAQQVENKIIEDAE
jgi:hypothetical protein